MTRAEAIAETSQLVAEGERLSRAPTLGGLRLWLQLTDDLLAATWGSMDRYHLAWLLVGRPAGAIRGRRMSADEEASYVREVVVQKSAALAASLDALVGGMPFQGDSSPVTRREADA